MAEATDHTLSVSGAIVALTCSLNADVGAFGLCHGDRDCRTFRAVEWRYKTGHFGHQATARQKPLSAPLAFVASDVSLIAATFQEY
jgi:hypothetical protein